MWANVLFLNGRMAFHMESGEVHCHHTELCESEPDDFKKATHGNQRPKPMKRSLKSKLLLAIFLLPFGMAQAIEWPPVVAAKIESVLALKQQAMDEAKMMRSKGGQAGKDMDTMLFELAVLLKKENLEEEVWKSSESDIREKIALWALDKDKRPAEYRRFPSLYVIYAPLQGLTRDQFIAQLPGKEEVLGLMYDAAAERPVVFFHPLLPEDVAEKYRLVIEYCLFVPPSGSTIYSENPIPLVQALVDIGNPKSRVLYEANLAMARKANIARRKSYGKDPNLSSFHNGEELSGFLSYPDEGTYRFLASQWGYKEFEDAIKKGFFRRLGGYYLTKDVKMHEEREAFLKGWQDLARQKWEGESEKSFAAWILTQKVPPLLPTLPPESN